jgi:hypothetical protein
MSSTESRLETARAQLAQVEALLETSPSDPSLLSLKDELRESMRLLLSLQASVQEASELLPQTEWTKADSQGAAPGAQLSAKLYAAPVVGTHFLPSQRCEVKPAGDKRWQGMRRRARGGFADALPRRRRAAAASHGRLRGEAVLRRGRADGQAG